jgi:hypothetical protein
MSSLLPLFEFHISASVPAATVASPSPSASTFVNRTGERSIGADHYRAFTNHQHPLLDQRPRDRRTGAGEDAGKGRPGNTHPLGGGLLVKTFEVSQPKGLELVEPQRLDLEFANPSADRLERPPPSSATDSPELFRSCHLISQLRTYAHN